VANSPDAAVAFVLKALRVAGVEVVQLLLTGRHMPAAYAPPMGTVRFVNELVLPRLGPADRAGLREVHVVEG
jgi:hypothetical protein